MSTTVFVYSMNRIGEVGAWSRYIFPFTIDHFTQQGDRLYIRAGDDVLVVDEDALVDYKDHSTLEADFTSTVQWPWLDFGHQGVTKKLLAVDVTGTTSAGSPVANVSIGTDQNNTFSYTTPFQVPIDTVPGRAVRIPVLAPSMSPKITFSSFSGWELQAVILYMQDQRMTA